MIRHRTWPVLLAFLVLAVVSCDREPIPTEVGPEAEALEAQEDALMASLAAPPTGEPVRVIIQMAGMGAARSMASTFGQARAQDPGSGARVLRTYNNFPLVAVSVPEQALDALRDAPGVVSVTLDVPVPPLLDNSLPVINADDVHALGWDGSGITVAILDTGIDEDHPFFEGRIVSQACYSTGGGGHDPGNGIISLCPGNSNSSTAAGSADIDTPECNNQGDLCDHGTHVAGIAAGGDGVGGGAPAAGVAPEADIIAIQVFTRFNQAVDCAPNSAPCVLAYVADQIAGLDRVYDLRNAYDIAAANMSLGGGQSATACDGDGRKASIDALLGVNIATAIAAGNNGFNASVSFPACISTAVAVGATDNADNLAGFTNRGVLLDLFAPGVGIFASGSGAGYESKNGTSMATPHVTGAWAVMRQLFPGASVADILNRLQTTGVDITYSSGGGDVTTPRIDLLAAIQTAAAPPVLTVDSDPVTVDEGETALNSGTWSSDDGSVSFSASIGSATDAGGGTWSWSFDTSDGPAESQTVTITGTDELGQSTDVTFELVVQNVAPTVTIDAGQATAVDESPDAVGILAHFTDPGTGDAPFSAEVLCWDAGAFGSSTVPGTVNVTGTEPVAAGDVTADCVFGDNGTFEVTVTVTDKDGASGSAAFDMVVGNVAPDVEIDETGAELINGVPFFLAQVGDPLSFDGHAQDPGSDDLSFVWDWDDGSTSSADYLVAPPDSDPFPSPSAGARDVWDTQSHSWTAACSYVVELTVTDDDDGPGTDEVSVIIAGDAGYARSQGYWQTEYKGRKSQLEDATLDCYLEIVGQLSQVFHEEVDASNQNKAAQVLKPNGRRSAADQLDVQLLTAWLNFANGAFGWDDPVDTDGDTVPDTPFSAVITTAESVRLDPTATDYELEMQKDILEYVNIMDE